MDVSCTVCKSRFKIPDEKVPEGAVASFTCPNCKNSLADVADVHEEERRNYQEKADKPFVRHTGKRDADDTGIEHLVYHDCPGQYGNLGVKQGADIPFPLSMIIFKIMHYNTRTHLKTADHNKDLSEDIGQSQDTVLPQGQVSGIDGKHDNLNHTVQVVYDEIQEGILYDFVSQSGLLTGGFFPFPAVPCLSFSCTFLCRSACSLSH